jgi:hypothetical protein
MRKCIESLIKSALLARVTYTEQVMAKPKSKPKSAMDALVDSFSDLVEDARKCMSPEEFRRAEQGFEKIIDKAKSRAPQF